MKNFRVLLLLLLILPLQWFQIASTKENTSSSSDPFYIDNVKLDQSLPIVIKNNTDFTNQAHTLGWSGAGSATKPFIIDNLFFSGDYSGPFIKISNTDIHFIIEHIYVYYPTYSFTGIQLINVKHGIITNNFFETGSNLQFNSIALINCRDVNASSNYFNTNQNSNSLYLTNTNDSIFQYNFFIGTSTGIYLNSDNNNNTITNNNFQANKNGIFNPMPFDSVINESNSIKNNYFNNNNNGLQIRGNIGVISRNIITSTNTNDIGMYFGRSIGALVTGNKITNNQRGIVLQMDGLVICSPPAYPECYENGTITYGQVILHQMNVTIIGNEFVNQHLEAITIFQQTDGNIIYDNNFIHNNVNRGPSQVLVEKNQTIPNYFTNGLIGNYWSNYNGTDQNNDGIGDQPYSILNDTADTKPLIKPMDFIDPGFLYYNQSYFTSQLKVYPQTLASGNSSTTSNTGINTPINLINLGILLLISMTGGIMIFTITVIIDYKKNNVKNLSRAQKETFREYLSRKFFQKRKSSHNQEILSDKTFEMIEEILEENQEK